MVEAKKKVVTNKAKVEKEDGVDKKVSKNTDEGTDQVQEVVAETTDTKVDVATAKAGKHSVKGIKEAEEKQAKIEHQKGASDDKPTEAKPKKAVKPARSRLERRSKKYLEVAKLIDKSKEYTLKEALELALKTNTTKFDATVELHMNLGVDPKHADQNIRGTVVLPAGSGRNVKVAVFGDVDDVKKAKNAGADIASGDEFLQQLDKGEINFDVLIATPMQMAKLGKYARILGPKGLMPNPKSGTVAKDVSKAVKEAKAGKVEYRVDTTGIMHIGVGKTNFKSDDLLENAKAIISAVKAAKPASVKGTYVLAVYITTTMGPSIKIALSEI